MFAFTLTFCEDTIFNGMYRIELKCVVISLLTIETLIKCHKNVYGINFLFQLSDTNTLYQYS